MISIGVLSFILVWWLQLIILYGNTFLPHFPAKMACKWAFYGKMGDEKCHHNDLGRGDGIDQNVTVISGLVAHILSIFYMKTCVLPHLTPWNTQKLAI